MNRCVSQRFCCNSCCECRLKWILPHAKVAANKIVGDPYRNTRQSRCWVFLKALLDRASETMWDFSVLPKNTDAASLTTHYSYLKQNIKVPSHLSETLTWFPWQHEPAEELHSLFSHLTTSAPDKYKNCNNWCLNQTLVSMILSCSQNVILGLGVSFKISNNHFYIRVPTFNHWLLTRPIYTDQKTQNLICSVC